MRVVSVNVARPRDLRWGERVITTAILKEPVAGRVRVGRLNLEGDGQSDLEAHGGESMAVYGYASEHYDFWRTELDRADLSFGMAGENLTISGLLETEVRVGDTFAVGSCVLQATQPRIPCYKLDAAFELDGMVERFREAHRYGVYFRVLEEGNVGEGDEVRLLEAAVESYAIERVGRLHGGYATDTKAVRELAELETLGPRARRKFRLLRDEAG